ncbi:MAG: tetratricopeptide repeat protein [Deltaproteobacteria bacterium]|nr:tetratricopeptide repeat protein [Deltaproteobacteria bacterium]
MAHQKMKKTVNGPVDKSEFIRRQTAVWMSVVMLVVGFIAGTIFGVMKTGPLSGGQSTVPPGASGKPPAQMFQALEAEAAANPQNAEAWVQLGNAYFDADQYQKAIDAYEKSLVIEPDNPNVLTDLGVMYRRSKQPEKAVEMFSRAMAVEPRHEVSRMNKGIVLLYDLKDEYGAVEAWQGLLEINPLATFGDGQSVDEMVRHYQEGHEKEGGNGK